MRRLNLRSTLSLCAPLLAGWFLLAQAQDSQFELTPDRSEMTVAELSQRVSDEVASLRIFESFTMPDSFERRRTLEIRRDEKNHSCAQERAGISRSRSCLARGSA